jgi:hypothetical protein
MPFKYAPITERFEQNHIPEPNSGCWLWLGALNKQGYGSLKDGRVRVMAHRYSYQLHKGPISEGSCIRHTCDTPWCVNPDHLLEGTWGDNNRDRARRGRNGIRWKGLCKNGHDLNVHGYNRLNGTRYCATCAGLSPRPKKGI